MYKAPGAASPKYIPISAMQWLLPRRSAYVRREKFALRDDLKTLSYMLGFRIAGTNYWLLECEVCLVCF